MAQKGTKGASSTTFGSRPRREITVASEAIWRETVKKEGLLGRNWDKDWGDLLAPDREKKILEQEEMLTKSMMQSGEVKRVVRTDFHKGDILAVPPHRTSREVRNRFDSFFQSAPMDATATSKLEPGSRSKFRPREEMFGKDVEDFTKTSKTLPKAMTKRQECLQRMQEPPTHEEMESTTMEFIVSDEAGDPEVSQMLRYQEEIPTKKTSKPLTASQEVGWRAAQPLEKFRIYHGKKKGNDLMPAW